MAADVMVVSDRSQTLDGLDALDLPDSRRPALGRRVLAAAWPKVVALVVLLVGWQLLVWSGWRPEYALPGPVTVGARLGQDLTDPATFDALARTLRRATTGYGLSLVLGTALGAAVSQVPVLRSGIGSLLTGLQTMPSIAWFPLAVLLFQLSESAIAFVVVLGATPAIANGLVAGVDYVPPTLVRAGRVLGARGLRLWWHVILPAALPGYLAGLKQGWAFAWRSLMAGELLVVVAGHPSLGVRLQASRDFADAPGLLATMVVVLAVGVCVDAGFTAVDRGLRRRRGVLVSG